MSDPDARLGQRVTKKPRPFSVPSPKITTIDGNKTNTTHKPRPKTAAASPQKPVESTCYSAALKKQREALRIRQISQKFAKCKTAEKQKVRRPSVQQRLTGNCNICGKELRISVLQIHEEWCWEVAKQANRKLCSAGDISKEKIDKYLRRCQSANPRMKSSVINFDPKNKPSPEDSHLNSEISKKTLNIICYLCGGLFSLRAIRYHEAWCLKRWRRANLTMPKFVKKYIEPTKYDELPQSIDHWSSIEDWHKYYQQPISCQVCGTRVVLKSLRMHMAQCTAPLNKDNSKSDGTSKRKQNHVVFNSTQSKDNLEVRQHVLKSLMKSYSQLQQNVDALAIVHDLANNNLITPYEYKEILSKKSNEGKIIEMTKFILERGNIGAVDQMVKSLKSYEKFKPAYGTIAKSLEGDLLKTPINEEAHEANSLIRSITFETNDSWKNEFGENRAQTAVQENDSQKLERLLRNNQRSVSPSAFTRLSNISSPLKIAIENGQMDIVRTIIDESTLGETRRWLMEHNLNFISPNKEGFFIYHLAAKEGLIDALNFFMQHHLDLNILSIGENPPMTCLQCAIKYRQAEVVMKICEFFGCLPIGKWLVTNVLKIPSAKPAIDSRNIDGFAALHVASQAGNISAVKTLLLNNANSLTKDNFGRTAFHLAVLKDSHEVLKFLLSWTSNLNNLCYRNLYKTRSYFHQPMTCCNSTSNKNTSKRQVRKNSFLSIKQYPIDLGNNKRSIRDILSITDNYGNTVIHFIALFESIKCLKLLMKFAKTHININLTNHKGETFLSILNDKINDTDNNQTVKDMLSFLEKNLHV